jgi:2-C-methyl-D-erythritol 4-phosphate cytidylyltransferase
VPGCGHAAARPIVQIAAIESLIEADDQAEGYRDHA